VSATSRWRRPAALVVALGFLAVTLLVAAANRPVVLSEVLLIVVVEVIAVSLVGGRAAAAATAIGASLAINWFLIPPYGTLHIAAQEDWVFLAVFLVLALGAAWLADAVVASERESARAAAHEAVLAAILAPSRVSTADALDLMRTAVDLDEVALVEVRSGEVLASTMGRRVPGYPACLEVDIAPGFRVRGWGPRRLGVRTDFATTLAAAVVRAWESEQLAGLLDGSLTKR
jgi:two-component system, OmpR family, sensor histidine kinase KdpD